MHKWSTVPNIKGLFVCDKCRVARYPIEKRVQWSRRYGLTYAYIYARSADYTLGPRSIRCGYWRLRHDQCFTPEELEEDNG